jgi:DNA-binding NarL/FixJ family response regulator
MLLISGGVVSVLSFLLLVTLHSTNSFSPWRHPRLLLSRHFQARPASRATAAGCFSSFSAARLDARRDAGSSVEQFGVHRGDPECQKRTKRWILFVDDEDAIRKAVGQLLSDKGYQVTTCADGATALQMALSPSGRRAETLAEDDETRPPDVIVSDVRMPGGMDGLELLGEIRSHEKLVEVPVILLTAKGMPKDRISGYKAGADAYIPKPFDPDELVSIIDNVIERHEQLSSPDGVAVDDLRRDLDEIKYLLLEKGGGGVGNGWIQATNVFLAPDERQVLELLCEGLMNQEIAEKTFLSRRRVEQLLTTMYRKAKVRNRTELVRWAVSTGQVQI